MPLVDKSDTEDGRKPSIDKWMSNQRNDLIEGPRCEPWSSSLDAAPRIIAKARPIDQVLFIIPRIFCQRFCRSVSILDSFRQSWAWMSPSASEAAGLARLFTSAAS